MPKCKIWHDIPGWKGRYKINKKGQVRSLYKKVKTKIKILKSGTIPGGYPHVALCREGKPKSLNIHDLVLLTFRGPKPKGKESCHNNGNKMDFRLSNLRYGTRRENALDRWAHGTMFTTRGPKNKLCKLTLRDLKWARKEIKKEIYSQRALAIFLGVTHNTLGRQLKNLNR